MFSAASAGEALGGADRAFREIQAELAEVFNKPVGSEHNQIDYHSKDSDQNNHQPENGLYQKEALSKHGARWRYTLVQIAQSGESPVSSNAAQELLRLVQRPGSDLEAQEQAFMDLIALGMLSQTIPMCENVETEMSASEELWEALANENFRQKSSKGFWQLAAPFVVDGCIKLLQEPLALITNDAIANTTEDLSRPIASKKSTNAAQTYKQNHSRDVLVNETREQDNVPAKKTKLNSKQVSTLKLLSRSLHALGDVILAAPDALSTVNFREHKIFHLLLSNLLPPRCCTATPNDIEAQQRHLNVLAFWKRVTPALLRWRDTKNLWVADSLKVQEGRELIRLQEWKGNLITLYKWISSLSASTSAANTDKSVSKPLEVDMNYSQDEASQICAYFAIYMPRISPWLTHTADKTIRQGIKTLLSCFAHLSDVNRIKSWRNVMYLIEGARFAHQDVTNPNPFLRFLQESIKKILFRNRSSTDSMLTKRLEVWSYMLGSLKAAQFDLSLSQNKTPSVPVGEESSIKPPRSMNVCAWQDVVAPVFKMLSKGFSKQDNITPACDWTIAFIEHILAERSPKQALEGTAQVRSSFLLGLDTSDSANYLPVQVIQAKLHSFESFMVALPDIVAFLERCTYKSRKQRCSLLLERAKRHTSEFLHISNEQAGMVAELVRFVGCVALVNYFKSAREPSDMAKIVCNLFNHKSLTRVLSTQLADVVLVQRLYPRATCNVETCRAGARIFQTFLQAPFLTKRYINQTNQFCSLDTNFSSLDEAVAAWIGFENFQRVLVDSFPSKDSEKSKQALGGLAHLSLWRSEESWYRQALIKYTLQKFPPHVIFRGVLSKLSSKPPCAFAKTLAQELSEQLLHDDLLPQWRKVPSANLAYVAQQAVLQNKNVDKGRVVRDMFDAALLLANVSISECWDWLNELRNPTLSSVSPTPASPLQGNNHQIQQQLKDVRPVPLEVDYYKVMLSQFLRLPEVASRAHKAVDLLHDMVNILKRQKHGLQIFIEQIHEVTKTIQTRPQGLSRVADACIEGMVTLSKASASVSDVKIFTQELADRIKPLLRTGLDTTKKEELWKECFARQGIFRPELVRLPSMKVDSQGFVATPPVAKRKRGTYLTEKQREKREEQGAAVVAPAFNNLDASQMRDHEEEHQGADSDPRSVAEDQEESNIDNDSDDELVLWGQSEPKRSCQRKDKSTEVGYADTKLPSDATSEKNDQSNSSTPSKDDTLSKSIGVTSYFRTGYTESTMLHISKLLQKSRDLNKKLSQTRTQIKMKSRSLAEGDASDAVEIENELRKSFDLLASQWIESQHLSRAFTSATKNLQDQKMPSKSQD